MVDVDEKYYEFINQFPSVKEYEDWKKERGIDLKTMQELLKTMLSLGVDEDELEEFLVKPIKILYKKFKKVVKTKDAKRFVSLRNYKTLSNYGVYDNFDLFTLGSLILKETKSVEDLYKMTHLRYLNGTFAAVLYEETINFLKANGEVFDATNPHMAEDELTTPKKDEEFDFKERIFKLEESVKSGLFGENKKRSRNLTGREWK